MILYTTAALQSPQPANFTVPVGMQGAVIQNISPWDFTLSSTHGDFRILPWSDASVPTPPGSTWTMRPSLQLPSLSFGLSWEVRVSYLPQPVTNFSQSSQLPAFAGTVNATIDTTGGPVDVSVTGTVDVGSVGSITEVVTTNSNLTNVVLNQNPSFVPYEATKWNINIPSAGGNNNANWGFSGINATIIDKVYFSVYSPNGNIDNYTISANPFWYQAQEDTPFYGAVPGALAPGNTPNVGVFVFDLTALESSGIT